MAKKHSPTTDSSSRETIDLLLQVPVFADLGPEELQQIADVAVPRTFAAGQVVFRKDDKGDSCYIVRSGRARAIREHADGRTITLANFGPGQFFGELAMFGDEPRSATVEAVSELQAFVLLGGDMRRLLRIHPDIALKLVITLGRRLREANDRLARQSFQTVQSRVAEVLLQLITELPEAKKNGSEILVKATQADIAKLAGSSRESASRFLAVLERAEIVSQGRGRLIIKDCDALKGYIY